MLRLILAEFLLFLVLILLLIVYILIFAQPKDTLVLNFGSKLWIPKVIHPSSKNEKTKNFVVINPETNQELKFNSKAMKLVTQILGNNSYGLFANSYYYICEKKAPKLTKEDIYNVFMREKSNYTRNLMTVLNHGNPLSAEAGPMEFSSDDPLSIDPLKGKGGVLFGDKFFAMLSNTDDDTINVNLGFLEPKIIIPPTKAPKGLPTVPTVPSVPTVPTVPKIIHQAFSTRFLDEGFNDAISSWVDMNPGYEYRYYDDNDMRKYIVKNCDSSILKAYDKLIPGAFKCDLFRLCVLYHEGGHYADIKMKCHVSLDKLISSKNSAPKLILTYDRTMPDIYNAYMASTPHHPLIKDCIEKIIDNCNSNYNYHPLDVTGPIMIGKVIKENNFDLNSPENLQLYHISRSGGQVVSNINDPEPLISTRANNRVNQSNLCYFSTGMDHYTILWLKNQVYHRAP